MCDGTYRGTHGRLKAREIIRSYFFGINLKSILIYLQWNKEKQIHFIRGERPSVASGNLSQLQIARKQLQFVILLVAIFNSKLHASSRNWKQLEVVILFYVAIASSPNLSQFGIWNLEFGIWNLEFESKWKMKICKHFINIFIWFDDIRFSLLIEWSIPWKKIIHSHVWEKNTEIDSYRRRTQYLWVVHLGTDHCAKWLFYFFPAKFNI